MAAKVRADLVSVDDDGLKVNGGGFHVDPWRPVPLAVLTHAHADHARPGSGRYLASAASKPVLQHRLGPDAVIEGLEYGEVRRLGDVNVSLHPAGHVLGSAQVRLESTSTGEIWVVSGDYKRRADPTCTGFEVVACDVFITEATFALPIYRWPDPEAEIDALWQWWQENRRAGKASVVFSYAFGKAQRVLSGLALRGAGTVWLHGAMLALTEIYRRTGLALPPTRAVADAEKGTSFKGELIVVPPSARGSTWMRRFGRPSTAFVSGWMTLRGRRRQRSVDRGFILSDHADWPALLRTVEETGARRVLTTHGYSDVLARYLRERGLDAEPLDTLYSGDGGGDVENTPLEGGED